MDSEGRRKVKLGGRPRIHDSDSWWPETAELRIDISLHVRLLMHSHSSIDGRSLQALLAANSPLKQGNSCCFHWAGIVWVRTLRV